MLAILVIVGNSYLWSVKADTSNSPPPSKPNANSAPVGLSTCSSDIDVFATKEFDKYKIWMEQNFSNKSSTSSLLGLGQQRYREFADTLQNKYQSILKIQIGTSNVSVVDQGQAFVACQNKVNDYIAQAADLLKLRVESTSAIKRTLIFVEKYKEINSKLRALNLDVLKLSVNLQSFNQKLPCYLSQCVK